MKNLTIVLIVLEVLLLGCKKHTDSVKQHDISGAVFNNCTDSGAANVTLFLQDGQGMNLSTVSGSDGSFVFKEVQIHSSSEYEYVIYVPSKSGTNAKTFEDCGFDGTRMYFKHDEADQFMKPRVTPRYLFFCMDFANGITIAESDSISIYYYQKTFHKNVPDLPYSGVVGKYGIKEISCGANYPMGQWNLLIEKWKNNVHTTLRDSIYLRWGESKSYIVNW